MAYNFYDLDKLENLNVAADFDEESLKHGFVDSRIYKKYKEKYYNEEKKNIKKYKIIKK